MLSIRFLCLWIVPLIFLSACDKSQHRTSQTSDDRIVVQDCANTLTMSSGFGDESIYLLEYSPKTNTFLNILKKKSDGVMQALYLCEQQKIFSTYAFRFDLLGRRSEGVEIHGKLNVAIHPRVGATNFVANQDEIFIESGLLQSTPVTPELGELVYDDVSSDSMRIKEPPPGANKYDLKYAINQIPPDAHYKFQPIYVWNQKELKQTRTLRKPVDSMCTNSSSFNENGLIPFFGENRISLLNVQNGTREFTASSRYPYFPSTMKNKQAFTPYPDILFSIFIYKDQLFLVTGNDQNPEERARFRKNSYYPALMTAKTIYVLNRINNQLKPLKTLSAEQPTYITQYGQFLYVLSSSAVERFDMVNKTSQILPFPTHKTPETLAKQNTFNFALVKIKDGFVMFSGDDLVYKSTPRTTLELFDDNFKHIKTNMTLDQVKFNTATSQYATHPEGDSDCWGLYR